MREDDVGVGFSRGFMLTIPAPATSPGFANQSIAAKVANSIESRLRT
ncbi:MAG: hypothetical protein V4857_27010 [Pseudomonadota bacterium]